MIGVVVVTHGGLAREFCLALEHIVGEQANIIPIGIGADPSIDTYIAEIANAIERVDSGKGVIILTDMFGGTPSNLAISFIKKGLVEMLAGVNLPMLVKLAKLRHLDDLQQVLLLVAEAGKKYITAPSSLFPEE